MKSGLVRLENQYHSMIDTNVKKKSHHIRAQETRSLCVNTYTVNLNAVFFSS